MFGGVCFGGKFSQNATNSPAQSIVGLEIRLFGRLKRFLLAIAHFFNF